MTLDTLQENDGAKQRKTLDLKKKPTRGIIRDARNKQSWALKKTSDREAGKGASVDRRLFRRSTD